MCFWIGTVHFKGCGREVDGGQLAFHNVGSKYHAHFSDTLILLAETGNPVSDKRRKDMAKVYDAVNSLGAPAVLYNLQIFKSELVLIIVYRASLHQCHATSTLSGGTS